MNAQMLFPHDPGISRALYQNKVLMTKLGYTYRDSLDSNLKKYINGTSDSTVEYKVSNGSQYQSILIKLIQKNGKLSNVTVNGNPAEYTYDADLFKAKISGYYMTIPDAFPSHKENFYFNFIFDLNGNVIVVEGSKWGVYKYTYDDKNRIASSSWQFNYNEAPRITRMVYTSNNQISQIIAGYNNTPDAEFEYNDQGLLTCIRDYRGQKKMAKFKFSYKKN